MATNIESFVKERATGTGQPVLGLLRLLAPETPAVRLDTLNMALPADRQAETREDVMQIERALDGRREQIEQTDQFRRTIEAIQRPTGLEYQTLPALFEYVSNEPRVVVNPTLDIFVYDPDASDGFDVPLDEIRDVERRLVRSVRDDLRHTDESVDLLAEYHRTYGEGLGIPPCEREWFAECYENIVTTGLEQTSTVHRGGYDSTELAGKLVAESPEHRSARAAMDRFIWDVLVHHVVAPDEAGLADVLENPPETFFARPTTGFYPHSPVCDRAIGLGKSVDGAIDDEAVRDLYRIELVYNNLKGLVVEYERYQRGLDLDTGEYFRTVDDRFEASERVERALDEMAEMNEGHRLFEYLVEQYY